MSHDHDPPQVLIVDDEPRNLDVLEVMLDGLGCALVRANGAEEALLAVVRHDFAALVIDIKMPGMNGIELAALIKQRRRSQHVPILLLTAHSIDESDLLLGYGAGAVDYLSKPIRPEILRYKVGVFVESFRNARSIVRLNEVLQREAAERKEAQEALRVANEDLERRVRERTQALLRAHQGVRENEQRLRMALDVARIAAWEWNLGTGQLQWSTDPERLFGFPAGAFGEELRIGRAVHPADAAGLEGAIASAVATGVYEAEYRAVRPDGTVIWLTERGQVGSDADASRMVGITRDVTTERELAHERESLLSREREARDEAERQGRLKDEFMATLSHELRTPMNAVLGWLQIIESGKPVKDTGYALTVIGRNARIQAKLIEDLLDMNRLMSGNLSLSVAPTQVGAVLEATVQTLQPAANEKGVELVVSAASHSVALADFQRLQQVLWNLIHNAIKFTPARGRVESSIRDVDNDVVIEIKDNGRGISPAFLPHVFERFRQQDGSSTRDTFGLGLGLAIAKQLVELHHGTIRALSAGDGLGATFQVSIPACRDAAQTRLRAGALDRGKSVSA